MLKYAFVFTGVIQILENVTEQNTDDMSHNDTWVRFQLVHINSETQAVTYWLHIFQYRKNVTDISNFSILYFIGTMTFLNMCQSGLSSSSPHYEPALTGEQHIDLVRLRNLLLFQGKKD